MSAPSGRMAYRGTSSRQVWFLVLLLGGLLTGCSGQVKTGDGRIGTQTLNVARTALAGGNPQMALNVARLVLKAHPGDSEALVDEGDAYYTLGDCARATRAYQRARHAAAHDAGAELGLGRCALQTNPRSAAADFARAVRDHPANAVALNDLGIAQAEQSQFGAAAASFRSAVSLEPTLAAATVNLGLVLALGGHPSDGAMILEPVARSAAATPKMRADYATALVLSGHADAAARLLQADMAPEKARDFVHHIARFDAALAGAATPLS